LEEARLLSRTGGSMTMKFEASFLVFW
jgi:hypothetical protein